MQKITTFLWYDHQAEEAAQFYTTLFDDSRIVDVQRFENTGPDQKQTVTVVTFELAGRRFMAMNGGPHDPFNDAVSLHVDCDSQEEIDRLWERLTADGGREVQCGWLKDRFGVSWQIVPRQLPELLADPDPARAGRAMQAMLGMVKLDIQQLKDAAEG